MKRPGIAAASMRRWATDKGPAIVVERGTMTLLLPRDRATVDA